MVTRGLAIAINDRAVLEPVVLETQMSEGWPTSWNALPAI